MGIAAHHHAQQYAWPLIAERICSLYETTARAESLPAER
jgi:hypothetical protein